MGKRRPSGDGMVRKRDDGRWEGRIVVGHKANGDPIFRHVYAKTQKALTEKLHQSIECYQDVELTEDSRMTLGEWLDRWLAEYKDGTIRPGTLEGYRNYIENYIKPQLGGKQVSLITTQDVQRMYRRLKSGGRVREDAEGSKRLSDSTVRHIHTMLHGAMKAAVQAHIIPKNPTENATVPKSNYKPMQVLNEQELDTFLQAVQKDDIWRDFFYTELMTGLRRGEICALMWRDFDAKAGTLGISRTLHSKGQGVYALGDTKTSQGNRTIILPESVAALLRARKKNSISQWIFPQPTSPELPMNPGTAYRRLKTLLEEAGLPSIRFHDLRHTFATHALTSGVDAKTLAGILGHTNASFTLDTYTHVTPDMREAAGGIVGGFLAGYVILLLEKVFSKIPASLNGLKAIFLYPLCSTAIVGQVMLGISGPMAAINQGMMDLLQSLGNSGPVILGLAIGCMCAFDMGGPVNKAAYATGTFLLGTALEAGVGTETYNFGTNFMAAVSAACIVPPLITTFAVVVGKKYFSQEDHDAGVVNLILGCTHITEGAIPFMTKNIWPVMPIMMLGSSIASILTIFFTVHDPAPHGGFLVLPVVENGPLWVLAILIGAVVGGILFVAFKKYDFEKNQKAAPVAKPVEAPKAAAVEAPKAEAADFVKVENVFVAEDFASRDEALSFVSNQAVKAGIASDADAVMNAFLAREAEGTTGMMEGFAIPHAKSDAITEAAVIVVKDESGVTGWDTMDGAPVNVAIALLIPGAQAGTTHLKILSKVAEALMDEDFRATVKGSTDAAEIAKTINARLV